MPIGNKILFYSILHHFDNRTNFKLTSSSSHNQSNTLSSILRQSYLLLSQTAHGCTPRHLDPDTRPRLCNREVFARSCSFSLPRVLHERDSSRPLSLSLFLSLSRSRGFRGNNIIACSPAGVGSRHEPLAKEREKYTKRARVRSFVLQVFRGEVRIFLGG